MRAKPLDHQKLAGCSLYSLSVSLSRIVSPLLIIACFAHQEEAPNCRASIETEDKNVVRNSCFSNDIRLLSTYLNTVAIGHRLAVQRPGEEQREGKTG